MAAFIGPLLVQAIFVEFLLHLPAQALSVGQVGVLWWLSIPACALALSAAGYRLLTREYDDPQLNIALVYFAAMTLVLLAISVVLMILKTRGSV